MLRNCVRRLPVAFLAKQLSSWMPSLARQSLTFFIGCNFSMLSQTNSLSTASSRYWQPLALLRLHTEEADSKGGEALVFTNCTPGLEALVTLIGKRDDTVGCI